MTSFIVEFCFITNGGLLGPMEQARLSLCASWKVSWSRAGHRACGPGRGLHPEALPGTTRHCLDL